MAAETMSMTPLSRRNFLRLGGTAIAAGALAPRLRLAFGAGGRPFDGTTLSQTIEKQESPVQRGPRGAYYRLEAKPGEPHFLRTLAPRTEKPRRRSLLHFVHLTDTHLADVQSPARVEFLDRYSDPGNGCEATPFSSAFRPQEALTLQVLEAMCRQVRTVRRSPVTGEKIAFAMCTGDNIDNQQFNELRWFIDLMDGGVEVAANSGGSTFEGVQAPGWADQEYWHPDEDMDDKFKRLYGFPEYPGLLEASLQPFTATGIGMPWYQTFGNHDGLMQGNAPRNDALNAIAVGPLKVVGAPPGLDPCDSFAILQNDPTALFSGPAKLVTADADRKIVTRQEYIEEQFRTTGTPVGHGFKEQNRTRGTGYYVIDDNPLFRLIALDTMNPGGYADGSIGQAQFDWLLARLREVHSRDDVSTGNADRLVILFSHHGLRSLNNPVITPDPMQPATSDLPRIMADEIEAAIHRFPNVIAWVNGHTHDNIVEPRLRPGGGFWDIGTAAHIDWSCQSRLVEVLDNGDGTLSILCTMIDHAGPIVPGGDDPVLRLASIMRELAANDYQYGFTKGRGRPQDRNVELVVRAPFQIPNGNGKGGRERAPVAARR